MRQLFSIFSFVYLQKLNWKKQTLFTYFEHILFPVEKKLIPSSFKTCCTFLKSVNKQFYACKRYKIWVEQTSNAFLIDHFYEFILLLDHNQYIK